MSMYSLPSGSHTLLVPHIAKELQVENGQEA